MSEVDDNTATSRFEMAGGGAVAFVEYTLGRVDTHLSQRTMAAMVTTAR